MVCMLSSPLVSYLFGYQDLVDIDVFQEAKKVIDALRSKEVGPALAWCADNKSRLKKSKVLSVFELVNKFPTGDC